jgi:hypothetical protein
MMMRREVRTVLFIAGLMMEAVGTSETSVYSNETTRRYVPKDSNLRPLRILIDMIFAYRLRGMQYVIEVITSIMTAIFTVMCYNHRPLEHPVERIMRCHHAVVMGNC